MTKSLIVICGATATGKSGLALELAQRLNTSIISADSRQIYQEFNIGTAKPTLEEQNLIPHYMIDICHPTSTFTLAEYQQQVQNILTDNSPFLLVGGTGLYIKSIVKGLKIPRVSPHPQLRSHLESFSQSERYEFLRQVDMKAANKIHFNDEFRTIRALEVYYVTGKPISEQQGENQPKYPILQIGLDCNSDALKARISKRTKKMLEMGLVEEVEKLTKKYGWDLPLLNTLGYGEIKQYLQGDISLLEAEKLIITHTRQFAKRQRTWFNAYPDIEWLNSDDPNLLDQVGNNVKSFLVKNKG